jgi:hypothetical protein
MQTFAAASILFWKRKSYVFPIFLLLSGVQLFLSVGLPREFANSERGASRESHSGDYTHTPSLQGTTTTKEVVADLWVPVVLEDNAVATSSTTHVGKGPLGGKKQPPDASSSPLDDVVRKLLPNDQAEEYIQRYPGNDFRFYVYDNLADEYTWQNISRCIAQRYKSAYSCDWGSSVCTQPNTTSPGYSKRRFNLNGDVVMAKILDEYDGPLKTTDPNQADLFIVPYSSAGNCECRRRRKFPRCAKNIPEEELKLNLLDKLDFFNASTRNKHLFLGNMDSFFRSLDRFPLVTTVGQNACKVGKNCGQIVVPYVNTNPENQPHALAQNHNKSMDKRQYALSAFMSSKISGNSGDRQHFFSVMKNTTEIGGRPVFVSSISHRSIKGEAEIMEMYRDSIFCPCLRGDSPPQKRIFDVILSGCIPVVIEHESNEPGYPSHFAARATSIRVTYPFAKGSFYNYANMGVDFSDLAVTVPGSCGFDCFISTLQDLLVNHKDVVREKQRKISEYASLFSFGMEQNGLVHADAVAALLVQARHYIHMARLPIGGDLSEGIPVVNGTASRK